MPQAYFITQRERQGHQCPPSLGGKQFQKNGARILNPALILGLLTPPPHGPSLFLVGKNVPFTAFPLLLEDRGPKMAVEEAVKEEEPPLKEEVTGSKYEAQEAQIPPHHQHPISTPRERPRGVL